MSAALAIRAGIVWTSDGSDGNDLVASLPESLRSRAGRIERPGAVALGAVGRLLKPDTELRRDLGVSVGTALGCFGTNAAYQRRLAAHGAAGASPRLFAATVSNAAAGEVGIAYGLGGPAMTVTSGMSAGLVAVDVARGELASGGVSGVVVVGLDVVDEAGRRWLRDAGWPTATPTEQVAALVLGDEPRSLPEVGRLGSVALGRFAGDPAAGIRRVVETALAEVFRDLAEVRVRCARASDAGVVCEALGTSAVEEPRDRPFLLAAGGVAGLLDALAGDEKPVVVVDVCPSGHVAAAVAWSTAR